MDQDQRKQLDIYDEGKFSYFFNAIFYMICMGRMTLQKMLRYLTFLIVGTITRILAPRRIYESVVAAHLEREAYAGKRFYKDRKKFAGSGASKVFWIITMGYVVGLMLIFVLCAGEWFLIDGSIQLPLIMIMLMGTLGLLLIDWQTFGGDRYWSYFKEFDKQDEHWRKIWRRITIVYCLGGWLPIILFALITNIFNNP